MNAKDTIKLYIDALDEDSARALLALFQVMDHGYGSFKVVIRKQRITSYEMTHSLLLDKQVKER